VNLFNLLRIKLEPLPITSQTVFSIGGFPVVNSFLTIILVVIIFIIFGYIVTKKFSLRPKRFQMVVEALYEMMVSLVDSITGSRIHSEKIFPVVGALIVYISFANLIVFIPGLTSITYHGIDVFRAPMSDYNTTFGLAFAMVVSIQFISIREHGIAGYFGRFFQFKRLYHGMRNGFGDFGMAIVDFLMGLLEIVSEIAKIISLSFRLFGNIFAGEILSVIILGALAYLLPSLWMVLDILEALIQAMVFGSLVAAYYTFSVKMEGEA